jgi:hypothetical protein
MKSTPQFGMLLDGLETFSRRVGQLLHRRNQ